MHGSFPTAAPGSTSSSIPRTACSLRIDRRRKLPRRSCCARSATETAEILDNLLRHPQDLLHQDEDRDGARARAPARRDGRVRHQGGQGSDRRDGDGASPPGTCASSTRRRSRSSRSRPSTSSARSSSTTSSTPESGEIIAEGQCRAHRRAGRADPRGRRQEDRDPLRQRPRPRSLHLQHPAHRSDPHPARGAGRDLPHDAPRRATDQGGPRRTCSTTCSSRPIATTSRRRADEVQPTTDARGHRRSGYARSRGHPRGHCRC